MTAVGVVTFLYIHTPHYVYSYLSMKQSAYKGVRSHSLEKWR